MHTTLTPQQVDERRDQIHRLATLSSRLLAAGDISNAILCTDVALALNTTVTEAVDEWAGACR